MKDPENQSAGSSAQWDRVDRILFAWLDEPDQRIGRELANLRTEDPTLARAVETRLGKVRELGRVLGAVEPADGPRVGAPFGDYQIERVLGQGGMGAVYLAKQTSLGRHVALKVIRRDRLRDQSARERFRREARAVAELRDPGICAVFDFGEVDATPYLAMQYVEGETLADRLAAQRVRRSGANETRVPTSAAEIGSALRMIEQVARSLHHAHQAGVVHRDVKPSNVMLDRSGQPVVLDFGLAHLDAGTDEPTLTLSGDRLGTPAYMSPEQVRPKGCAIDRRTDVYSLAVTLYECLTLEHPFVDSSQIALFERIERDPTPDPRWRNPHLPHDLSAVLGKAMEKDPAARYATAEEFADDLRRILEHEPVRARRIGTVQRLGRWCRRNPWAATLVLVLTTGLTATGLLLRMTSVQRDAIASLAEASRIQGLVGASAVEATIDPMLSLRLALAAAESQRTPATLDRLRSSLQAAAEKSLLRGHKHYVTHALLSPDGSLLVTGSLDGTVRVWGRGGQARHTFALDAMVTDLVLVKRATQALCTTFDGKLHLLDLEKDSASVLAKVAAPAYSVQPLADGRIACGFGNGKLEIISADHAIVREFDHPSSVWVVASSPRHARFVATADWDGVVRIFDLDATSTKPYRELPTGNVVDRLRFAPERDELLIVNRAGRIMVLGLQDPSAPPIASCRHGETGTPIQDAVWAPNGERFLTVGEDYHGRLWRRDGTLENVLAGHTGEIYACAVSPDGAYWATAGDDACIRIWNAHGDLFTEFRGHSSPVRCLSFASNGHALLSGSKDCTARLWDLTIEGSPVLMSPTGSFTTARFVHLPGHDDEIVTATKDGHVVFWNRAGVIQKDIALPEGTRVESLALDTGRQRMIVGLFGGNVHVFDLATHERIRSWRNLDRSDPATRMVAVDAAGKVLLAKDRWGSHPATLAWTDLELAEPKIVASLPDDYILHAIALDSSGQRIYLAGSDGSIRIYARDGVPGAVAVQPSGEGLLGIELSPDGKLLGATCVDRMARLYDVGPDGSLCERCVLRGHENELHHLHFAPSGRMVTTTSHDCSARVWSASGVLLATIRGHTGFVYDAEFSPDEKSILSCGSEGTARFWLSNPEDLFAAARARLRHGFDAEEHKLYGQLLDPAGK